MGDLMMVSISRIDPDPSGIQPREMLDGDVVKRYAEQIRDGAKFPPVRLWDIKGTPGAKFRVSDGYHRFTAHKQAGLKEIHAEVFVGTMIECVEDAIASNAIHGKALTDAERYTAMLSYLGMLADAKKPMPSIRFLKDMAGVSHATAKRVLRDFKASPSAEPSFEDRSPTKQLSERLTQGVVSDLRSESEEKSAEDAVQEVYSETKATVDKLIHDGKVKAANLRNAISAVVKAYEACESCETGVYFTHNRSSFDKAVTMMRKIEAGCRPERECACEGQGCSMCNGYGWINGHQARNAS